MAAKYKYFFHNHKYTYSILNYQYHCFWINSYLPIFWDFFAVILKSLRYDFNYYTRQTKQNIYSFLSYNGW